MDNNLFVSTTFFPDNTPISQVIYECENQGITNLELGSNHIWEENQLEIVKNYVNNNYLVHNYFPTPKLDLIVNIASLDENIRKCQN